MVERVAIDVDAYERRTRSDRCFICRLVNGEPDSEHEEDLLLRDDAHVAFVNRYPTLTRVRTRRTAPPCRGPRP